MSRPLKIVTVEKLTCSMCGAFLGIVRGETYPEPSRCSKYGCPVLDDVDAARKRRSPRSDGPSGTAPANAPIYKGETSPAWENAVRCIEDHD